MHFLSNAASANESIKKYSYMRKSWVFLKQGVLMKNFVFQGGLRTKAFFGNFFKYIIYKIIGMPILPSMQRLKLKYKPFSLVGVVNQSAYAWKRNGNIQEMLIDVNDWVNRRSSDFFKPTGSKPAARDFLALIDHVNLFCFYEAIFYNGVFSSWKIGHFLVLSFYNSFKALIKFDKILGLKIQKLLYPKLAWKKIYITFF